jgi:hypothetical protein
MLGLFLLTLSLGIASCQAFIGTLPHMDVPPAIDQRDIHGQRDT